MSPAADDFESIRRRLEELAAEKSLALTGSTTEPKPTENEYLGEAAIGWPYASADLASYALFGDTIYVWKDGKIYTTPSYL